MWPRSLRSKKERPSPRSGRWRLSSVSLWPSKTGIVFMRRILQDRLADADDDQAKARQGVHKHVSPASIPRSDLVLGYARVDLLAPGRDAAFDVVDVLETRVLQQLDGPGAASSGLAVDHEVLVLIQLHQTLRQLAEGYEPDTDVGDFVLVRLAHVEHVDLFLVVQLALEILNCDLRHAVLLLGGGCLRDTAELLVVDEFGHGRILAADGAVGVLAKFHLAEAHAQSVVEQKPSDERLADPEYELEGLGGLDGSDGAGKDAEHPALRATRYEPRRRRLGIEATVARTFLGIEHACLALEAEDGTVDIGLAKKYARVVHEVTCREVVRAVHYDVVVLEDFQRVFARQGLFVNPHLDVGIYVFDLLVGALYLGTSQVGGAVDDLTLQVRLVHDVEVHDPDGPCARRREIERERAPETTSSHGENLRGLELLLPVEGHLGHYEVPAVASNFLIAQLHCTVG